MCCAPMLYAAPPKVPLAAIRAATLTATGPWTPSDLLAMVGNWGESVLD